MLQKAALPAELYTLAEKMPETVLLEGNPQAASDWTRLFVAPRRICSASTPAEVALLFRELEEARRAGLFAAGYLAYECGACFEPKAHLPAPAPGEPLAWFGLYDRYYVYDRARQCFPEGEPPELAAVRAEAVAAAESAAEAELPLSPEEYARAIDAIHGWIRSGDVYQLNFTVPLALRSPESFAALYRRLRAAQPASHGAFVHARPGHRILSFSPELFFRLEGRSIETRPMKGTAPRGRSTEEDRALAEWLRNDAKNRAENLMIVDLLRNDLGRLARFGTVRAEPLFALERHPTLWQMTSTVRAELRDEVGLAEIFRALFPSGSITGAPKVRAMQLLAQLEARPRGVYTGSIGFIAPGSAEFNVAIRTLEFSGGQGQVGVGGGIVIDSQPDSEFAECKLKAAFLTKRPPEFDLLESLLWRGEYPLLGLHLDRLEDSAAYFGFPFDRAALRAALEDRAGGFADSASRKVRLLLHREGGWRITEERVRPSEEPVRVCLAGERTDPADPFLFHKTTHRPLYARSFAEAQKAGFGEVLFRNRRGELTEGAISNLFVVKGGRWRTPLLACGLLAGVARRQLLAQRPEIEECVLTLEDLRAADAVYLTNAVRGLRRAVLDWNSSLR